MKSAMLRIAVGLALLAGVTATPLCAQEGTKTLPTLLIKGEVVSLDSTDPAATLLKVKDRYGFETPIYIPQDARISQGEVAATASSLTAGTAVEVEYNFDINTAKRHAVTVKLAALIPAPATAAAPEPAAPNVMAPVAMEEPAEAAPAEEMAPEPAESAAPEAEPAAAAQ